MFSAIWAFITWPFRKIYQLIKWILMLPIRLVKAIFSGIVYLIYSPVRLFKGMFRNKKAEEDFRADPYGFWWSSEYFPAGQPYDRVGHSYKFARMLRVHRIPLPVVAEIMQGWCPRFHYTEERVKEIAKGFSGKETEEDLIRIHSEKEKQNRVPDWF